MNAQCIDEDECIASVDSSLCFEPGHADVNDFFGDIGFRFALAIDAHRRQCDLHLRHSRFTSSAEIEVAHNMAHLVATPRRRRRRKRRRRTRRRLKRRRRRRKEEERGGGGGEAKGRRRWKHAFSFGMEIRAVCTLHFLKEKDGAQRRRALHFLKEILVARTLGFG